VVIPTPQFPEYLGVSICTKQPFRPYGIQACKIAKSEMEIYGKWSHIIQGLQRAHSSVENIFVFDTRRAFCASDGKCRNFSGEEMLFIDTNHLRREGALMLYPEFEHFLESNKLIH
jgi:hypothetical protein